MSYPRALETLRFTDPVPYTDAYARQIERRDAIEEGKAGNALFLLEHDRTFTMGRSAHEENLLHTRAARSFSSTVPSVRT